MGNVKIRYYVTRQAWPNSRKWGYWVPCLKRNGIPTSMAKLGFGVVDCGEDGPAAWAIAQRMNERWDKARRGETGADARPGVAERVYPSGSLGEAYGRFRATQTWAGKAPRTREDWERGWRLIEPVFGDVNPQTVALEDIDLWYAGLLDTVGVRESHRAMKIWRALWRVAGSINRADGRRYCDRDADPSLGIRRKTPQARQAIWYEGEAVRLVKRAIRMDKAGLAAALAVAWDTMLSPVDVRPLTLAVLTADGEGSLFSVARAKTGRSAIGTLSKRTLRLLKTYVASLPFELHNKAEIFRTAGAVPGPNGGRRWQPRPYSKDTLAKDFRVVRDAEFPGDQRKVMDFRRSGAVEATAGGVDPQALAGKMANTIDTNRDLQATYLPHTAQLVRLADAARQRGRGRLRGSGKGET